MGLLLLPLNKKKGLFQEEKKKLVSTSATVYSTWHFVITRWMSRLSLQARWKRFFHRKSASSLWLQLLSALPSLNFWRKGFSCAFASKLKCSGRGVKHNGDYDGPLLGWCHINAAYLRGFWLGTFLPPGSCGNSCVPALKQKPGTSFVGLFGTRLWCLMAEQNVLLANSWSLVTNVNACISNFHLALYFYLCSMACYRQILSISIYWMNETLNVFFALFFFISIY